MDKLLSSLDNLEKDITDFLNRKTKFDSLRFGSDKADENFNMVITSSKHRSLDVTSSRDLPQVAHRHSDWFKKHEARRSAHFKRQGILFPCDLDIIEAGRGGLSGEESAKMNLDRKTPSFKKESKELEIAYSCEQNNELEQRELKRPYSNVIMELHSCNDEDDSALREKLELRVRVINEVDTYGQSSGSVDRIVQDLRLPLPEDLNADAEESWFNIFKTLCKINGSTISEELTEIGQSGAHQIINEYFV